MVALETFSHIKRAGQCPDVFMAYQTENRIRSPGKLTRDSTTQEIEEYSGLPDDLVGAAKRWIEWLEFERPEDEPLPGDYSCIRRRVPSASSAVL